MNESYIDIVRKSLYEPPKNIPGSSKKIVFLENCYKSHNVFEDISDDSFELNKMHKSAVRAKLKKKKGADNLQAKKNLRGKKSVVTDLKKKNRNLELISKADNDLSKSFLCFSKHGKNNFAFLSDDNDEEKEEEFDMDNFFNTRDHSFSESITEPHSGVDYEFITDHIKAIKITSIGKNTVRCREAARNLKISKGIKKKVSTFETEGKTEYSSFKRAVKSKKIEDNKLQEDLETLSFISHDTRIENGAENEPRSLDNITELEKSKKYAKTHKLKDQKATGFSIESGNNKLRKKDKRIGSFNSQEISENTFSQGKEYDSSLDKIKNKSVSESISEDEERRYNNNDSSMIMDETNNKTSDLNHLEQNCQPKILDIANFDCDVRSKIIILTENMDIPFYGMFTLQVIHGQVEVLGKIFNNTSFNSKVFSPRGSSLLSLKNVTNDSNTSLNRLLPNSNVEDIPIDNKTAVVKCTKLHDKCISLLEKYISQQIFPKLGNNAPQIIFQPKEEWNVTMVNESWNDVINIINPYTKLLIVGGKGVGKSTFLRYAINKLLTKYEVVRVIDLDPGQPEFTVPGCISVLSIKEVLLGPNYTHLRRPERSLLSDINIGHNPSTYIRCIASLMKYVSSLDRVPTLINYMGFSKGIGIKIISSAISYIQPTDIVQINSTNYKKNFSEDLNLNVIKKNCKFFGGDPNDLNFNLHIILSMTDQKVSVWSLEPRQIREMCTLTYLGQMMKDHITTLTAHQLPMYKIDLTSIKLTNIEKEELPPAAVNANLVALCSLEDSNTFICLGYGVVRGIDLENNELILITPESIEVLEKVFYLVLGSVSLPPSVYMMPENVSGLVPYVMEGELKFLGQITKRTYMPASKKRVLSVL